MTWYLVILMATGVTVERMDGKNSCEAIRAEILSVYARGSALVDVRCLSVLDSGPQPARK